MTRSEHVQMVCLNGDTTRPSVEQRFWAQKHDMFLLSLGNP